MLTQKVRTKLGLFLVILLLTIGITKGQELPVSLTDDSPHSVIQLESTEDEASPLTTVSFSSDQEQLILLSVVLHDTEGEGVERIFNGGMEIAVNREDYDVGSARTRACRQFAVESGDTAVVNRRGDNDGIVTVGLLQIPAVYDESQTHGFLSEETPTSRFTLSEHNPDEGEFDSATIGITDGDGGYLVMTILPTEDEEVDADLDWSEQFDQWLDDFADLLTGVTFDLSGEASEQHIVVDTAVWGNCQFTRIIDEDEVVITNNNDVPINFLIWYIPESEVQTE